MSCFQDSYIKSPRAHEQLWPINVNLSIHYSYGLLLLSVLVGLIRNTLLNLWLILELNTILFILILFTSEGLANAGSLVKYFVIQTFRSVGLILGGVTLPARAGPGLIIIQICIIVKLGALPGHGWYLSVIQRLGWANIFTLSTIQKLMPLFLLIRISRMAEVLIISATSVISGLFATSSIRLKRLIGYSSILNVAWLVASSLSLPRLFFFFSAYSGTMGLLSLYLAPTRSGALFDSKVCLTHAEALTLCGVFLRLRGIPPFINFWAKLIVLKALVSKSLVVAIYIMLMTGWIVYVYTRMIEVLLITRGRRGSPTLKLNNSRFLPFNLLLFGGLVIIL